MGKVVVILGLLVMEGIVYWVCILGNLIYSLIENLNILLREFLNED